jgi:hypothetical protein
MGQQALDAVEHAAALAVELVGADSVDRGADPFLGDPVVADRGLDRIVPHQARSTSGATPSSACRWA